MRPDDAEPFSGHAFKIDLDVAELRLVPAGGPSSRRTVEEIVAPYPAVVAINASFFDKEDRAMGLAVDDGRLLGGGKRQSWGALVVDGKKARITTGAEINDHLAHRLIVQGIPRLVVAGKVQGLKPQLAARTAVCAEGSVVIFVVSTKAETTAFARIPGRPVRKRRGRMRGCPQPRRGPVDTACGQASRTEAIAARPMGGAERARRCSGQEVGRRCPETQRGQLLPRIIVVSLVPEWLHRCSEPSRRTCRLPAEVRFDIQ